MDERTPIEIIGRQGLHGVLLDPLPASGSGNERVRVQLDQGEVVELPVALLWKRNAHTYEVPLAERDLVASRSGAAAEIAQPRTPLAPEPLPSRAREPEPELEAVVPVLQEELRVSKDHVQQRVRVHRLTDEETQVVDVPLRKESVDVQRIRIEQQVAGPLPVRQEGATTIIPVVEEVLVVERRYILREEVHVTRRAVEERHHEEVTLQRQHVEVERTG